MFIEYLDGCQAEDAKDPLPRAPSRSSSNFFDFSMDSDGDGSDRDKKPKAKDLDTEEQAAKETGHGRRRHRPNDEASRQQAGLKSRGDSSSSSAVPSVIVIDSSDEGETPAAKFKPAKSGDGGDVDVERKPATKSKRTKPRPHGRSKRAKKDIREFDAATVKKYAKKIRKRHAKARGQGCTGFSSLIQRDLNVMQKAALAETRTICSEAVGLLDGKDEVVDPASKC